MPGRSGWLVVLLRFSASLLIFCLLFLPISEATGVLTRPNVTVGVPVSPLRSVSLCPVCLDALLVCVYTFRIVMPSWWVGQPFLSFYNDALLTLMTFIPLKSTFSDMSIASPLPLLLLSFNSSKIHIPSEPFLNVDSTVLSTFMLLGSHHHCPSTELFSFCETETL